MKEFKLRILEAEGEFYNGKCVSIIVPLEDGLKGILADHVNTIAAMIPGALSYKEKETDEYITIAVANGIVKIEDNSVLVLTDALERIEDIDVGRANEKKAEALRTMKEKQSVQEYKQARLRLHRAVNRLKLSR